MPTAAISREPKALDNLPFIKRWVEALESGKFTQCRNGLIERIGYAPGDDINHFSYCCLGVAALLAGAGSQRQRLDARGSYELVQAKIGHIGDYVVANDVDGCTFEEIAKGIREAYPEIFKVASDVQ